jgi:hypothetical protein
VYDTEKHSLMVVDLERVEIYDRQALQPIDANSRGRKRKRAISKLEVEPIDEFKRELQIVIQSFRRVR